ncbi:HtaA domain-containing protein [Streptacidiphilus sp. N1-10]|uniref:HtaA domain-containing protein n=1 Tax=Streptacidiphilus jeojiensis TaxID=3229225 RepID=A0ABV6XGZ8_9ACTN
MSGTVRPGALRWAVKDSFVHYVRVIAGGSCEVLDGAEPGTGGAFVFPLLAAEEDGEGRTLSFGGAVRFQAHHGFLDVELRDLQLRLTEGGGALSIRGADGGRVTVATTAPAAAVQEAGLLRWPALVPYLTEAGVAVFGDVYAAGSEFAPIDAAVLIN